jgi:hypothetical protein
LKIAFQADADLDPDIGRGLRRREPSIDFQAAVGAIPDGTPDPQVLYIAAEANRVLVTGDLRTMTVHFREFVGQRESPGVPLVPSSRSIGAVIDGILMIWLTWSPDDLRNQIWWLP